MTVNDIREALEQHYDAGKAEVLPRFFKSGPGEYAEGDRFIGVAVPHVRKVARQYKDAPLTLVDELLNSPLHECRSCALFILTNRFKRSKLEEERKTIYDFYLAHAPRINNWDLVDCSAPHIVGAYLMDKPRAILRTLLRDPLLWRKRIAVVACWWFIRQGDYADIFSLTLQLLSEDPKPHDLMQKACGWMLREVHRKGDKAELVAFLEQHATILPRTTLRYAIERMSPSERQHFMTLH